MRLRVVVFLCALSAQWFSLLTPLPAHAEASGPLISELQVAGANSASDEFVELYNPASDPVDLKNYQLEYHSATSTSDCSAGWTTKAKVATGAIPGHGFYLFSSKDYLPAADQTFASGLASAGSIRLVDADGGVTDALAWGAGKCGAGAAAHAPTTGHSLERRPGADLETAGNAYDTGDNNADFLLRATPAPQSTASAPEEPATDYTPAPATTAAGNSSDGAALELNELFPDPASPLTDAADEFVELYNPNPFPVSVAGYVVKTGASLSTKHTLASGTVPAEGYLAFKSATTKIALSNSGSSVALFDPDGNQLGATVTYPKAKTGAAWARADDVWSWTGTPTPSAANILADPTGVLNSTSSSSSSKSTAKAKTSTAKAKTTKAKATKAATVSSKTSGQPTTGTTPGGRWLLFALAGLTIAYVIYEFRYDVQNFYFKLRGHPGRRRAAGQAAPGQ
jgi:hypothetical protein